MYRVHFRDGEKRVLDIEAGRVIESKTSYVFHAASHPASAQVAVVPRDVVLYVEQLKAND